MCRVCLLLVRTKLFCLKFFQWLNCLFLVKLVTNLCDARESSYRVNLHGGAVPWLLKFVPKVGLKFVKNGILKFSGANILEHLASSFIEALCHLRQQSNYYENLMRKFYIALKENECTSSIYTKSESN